MTIITFPKSSSLDPQAEYAEAEADFARTQELIAQAIFRNELRHYRFQIGDVLHDKVEGRCALCDGRFPKRGAAYAVWMPKELGGECRPVHTLCFLGVSSWI